MNVKFSIKVIVATSLLQSFAFANTPKDNVEAWSAPSWSFASSRTEAAPAPKVSRTLASVPASRSLIFDQSFDQRRLRPLPEFDMQAQEPVKKEEAPAPKPQETLATVMPDGAELFVSPFDPLESYFKVGEPALFEPGLAINPTKAVPATTVASVGAPQVRTVSASGFIHSAGAREIPAARPVNVKPAAPVVAAVAPTPAAEAPVVVAAASAPKKAFKWPGAEKAFGVLAVVSEESLSTGQPEAVAGASVTWIGAETKITSTTDAKGVAKTPYPKAYGLRFLVRAPGFLPALGYATANTVTPVALFKEERLGPVMRSLGITPIGEDHIVLGKVLDNQFKPIDGIAVSSTMRDGARAFYTFGPMGLFHPQAQESGATGDFLLSAMAPGLQYFMPSQYAPQSKWTPEGNALERHMKDWAAYLLDLTGTPNVVTVTLRDAPGIKQETQLMDNFSGERPDTAIHAIIGGQRGLVTPNEEGLLKLDRVAQNGHSGLLEVRARGYRKSWVSLSGRDDTFPDVISLFTEQEFSRVFEIVRSEVDPSKALALARLRIELFTRPVQVKLYDGEGKLVEAPTLFYFDRNGEILPGLKKSDINTQSFAIANLVPGEWHAVVVDAATQKPLAAQSFRTDTETITQLQF